MQPVARPKRFDEKGIGFLLIELGLLINGVCWYLVGRALKADPIATIDDVFDN